MPFAIITNSFLFERILANWQPGWPKGAILTLPLAPRGEICPLVGMFTPSFTPRGEHSLLFRRMEGRTGNFTPGDNLPTRGQNSPLGSKFVPRVKVKNRPLMSLWKNRTKCSPTRFCPIYIMQNLNRGKRSPKMWAPSTIKKPGQSKQSPNGRKIAQSGHPDDNAS
jgi:hypothetical protein